MCTYVRAQSPFVVFALLNKLQVLITVKSPFLNLHSSGIARLSNTKLTGACGRSKIFRFFDVLSRSALSSLSQALSPLRLACSYLFFVFAACNISCRSSGRGQSHGPRQGALGGPGAGSRHGARQVVPGGRVGWSDGHTPVAVGAGRGGRHPLGAVPAGNVANGVAILLISCGIVFCVCVCVCVLQDIRAASARCPCRPALFWCRGSGWLGDVTLWGHVFSSVPFDVPLSSCTLVVLLLLPCASPFLSFPITPSF